MNPSRRNSETGRSRVRDGEEKDGMTLGFKSRAGVKEPLSSAARVLRVLYIVALLAIGLPLSAAAPTPAAHASSSSPPPILVSDCTTEQGLTAALATVTSFGTIQFTCDGTIPITSTIAIDQSVTITGRGHSVTLDGGNANRLFTVATSATASVQIVFAVTYLTLANGNAVNAGSGGGRGGAIYAGNAQFGGAGPQPAVIHAGNDTFTSNSGTNGGAIAANFGNLTVTNSTFSANQATAGNGGAIGDDEPPPPAGQALYAATLAGNVFSGNTATGTGGAIGLGTNSPATITDSTFFNNSAPSGGSAIGTFGTVNLLFSTVAGNYNGSAAISDVASGTFVLQGNIFDNATNCSRTDTWTDSGYNLQSVNNSDCGFSAGTDVTGDPLLGALQDNGGPTQTMWLGPGSPALGAGQGCPLTDQRNLPRPASGCDIGAFQNVIAQYDNGENAAYSWGGTATNALAITGIGEPGGVVNLYSGALGCGGTPISASKVLKSGAFAVAIPTIATEGSYQYSTSVTNPITGAITCAGAITANIDRTAPTSTVTSPALGTSSAYINSSTWASGCGSPTTVGVCGTASDAGGSQVAAVYVAIENSSGQFWNGSAFSSTGAWLQANGTTSWSLGVPQLPDGEYTIASAAVDNAGNTQPIFESSVAGLCDPSGSGGQLSLNGGELSINGGACLVDGTSGGLAVSGQLSLNGGQLSLNGGQLSLNGGQLSLNGGSCTVRDNTGTSGTLTITGGTLVSSGGQLSLNGGMSVSGGQLSLNGGQLSLNGGQLSLNGGQLSLNGGDCTFTASGGASGQLSLNGGQLSLNGGQLSLNGGQFSITGGQLSLNGGQLSLNGGQLSLNGGAGGNAGNVVFDTVQPYVSNFTVDGQSTSGTVNVNPGATFHIAFDESMKASTINSSSISVVPSTGTFTPSITVDPTGLTASFSGFQPLTSYTVTVSQAAMDLAGNPLSNNLGANPTTFTFTTAAFSSLPPNSTASQDTDGDDIPNGWDGTSAPVFTLNGQSTNTAAWGFSSQHKDLCLVENYMSGTAADGHLYNQAISQAANQAIVNAFAASPVTNPNGTNGVHLVIFEGDAAHSAGLPSGYSGPYFGGQIPMTDPLGDASTGSFNWGSVAAGTSQSFESIRTANFVSTGLAQFCHYAVIAHTLGGSFASGASRGIGASDLVVALGGTVVGAGLGTQSEQQGTVMHELGHNLGLHHGGGPGIPDLDVNYKPSYMSVMNYFYQFTGVPGGFTSNGLDYSHGTNVGTPLDESNLLDSIGLGSGATISGGASFGTRYFCPGTSGPQVVGNASQPIDWTCTGISGSPVQAFINGDTSGYQVLHDYNDWANLQFNGGDIGEGAVLPPPTSTTIDISGVTDNDGTFTPSGGVDDANAIEGSSLARFGSSGFLSPVSGQPTVNVGKAGKTYPVKFQLKDSKGNFVTWLSAVTSVTVGSTSCSNFSTQTDPLTTTTSGSSGLRYDSTANQFIYNWATPARSGCYTLNVNLADGTQQQANFNLK